MASDYIEVKENVPHAGSYDVIVAGGGVAGAAAAVAAARGGARVLLTEKTVNLGGLATTGLINLFVPLCNGRGKQIITGMAEEFLRLSVKYGFDTLPEEWKSGPPDKPTLERYVTRFSAPVFSLALSELMVKEDVDVLFDTVVSRPVVTEKGIIDGVITESKSGREYYSAKTVIDVTGDADLLFRAGVPTVQGRNYFTYSCFAQSLDSMRRAIDADDVSKVTEWVCGGNATLYGEHQRKGERLYEGTSNTDVTEYMLKNQLLALEKIKTKDRKRFDVVTLPYMPQFRTTRRIDGDYTLKESDKYRHFDDSVGAICDFDRRDFLYEVPFRTLVNGKWKNVITAGRCAAGEGYAWDVLRVIPPAILTGQAAGTAAALSVKHNVPVTEINVALLQKTLEKEGVTIHFDDALVPENQKGGEKADIGHF